MKRVIFALGIVASMYVLMEVTYNKDIVVEQEAVESPVAEIQVETVDVLEDRIKEAQNAKLGELEASAQEAYDEYMEIALKQIEDQVKAEYIAEIEATISDASY